ncbi:AI-2E family transporter [Fodinibius sediminis]|uniref:Predicted PurR-regulated permease PerM n=1 Tax=Fodinibius sediminis TaxID=1214077 RepID=A0A521DC52_9BACT|nr:AI-2E family transporter [Fodinibius sediminis]SMO68490.1 Predicted PurR-regulated permease PerM [Fodinibius sediminis]
MNRPYPLWLKGTTLLLGVILIFIILIHGKFILMPLTYAALIAMLLEPLSQRLERLKLNRIAAILISIVLVFVILLGIISLLSMQLVQFADRLPEANQKIQAVSSDILQFMEATFNVSPSRQLEYLEQGLSAMINKSGQYMSTALGATTSVFTTLGLLPFFVFFMMYYKEMYRTFLHKLMQNNNKLVNDVIDGIQGVTQNYIIGMLTVITLLAVLNAIGLWILGMEHVLFFAAFAAILAIIPYVGIIIGSLPAIIFALLFTESLWNPVGVIAVFAVVQFLEGNFITPNIVGSRVSINPMVALLALLIGGELWGISGMILFVPIVGVLKHLFDQVESLKPLGYLFGDSREYS